MLDSDAQNRLWSKIDKQSDQDCWLYKGSVNSSGYGVFKLQGKQYYAHRLVYELKTNSVLHKRVNVCHKCDVKTCCNYKHLFAGSQLDNMRDKISKGRARWLSGMELPQTKLSKSNILDIQTKYDTGNHTQRCLAKDYNVSIGTINRAIHRR